MAVASVRLAVASVVAERRPRVATETVFRFLNGLIAGGIEGIAVRRRDDGFDSRPRSHSLDQLGSEHSARVSVLEQGNIRLFGGVLVGRDISGVVGRRREDSRLHAGCDKRP